MAEAKKESAVAKYNKKVDELIDAYRVLIESQNDGDRLKFASLKHKSAFGAPVEDMTPANLIHNFGYYTMTVSKGRTKTRVGDNPLFHKIIQ